MAANDWPKQTDDVSLKRRGETVVCPLLHIRGQTTFCCALASSVRPEPWPSRAQSANCFASVTDAGVSRASHGARSGQPPFKFPLGAVAAHDRKTAANDWPKQTDDLIVKRRRETVVWSLLHFRQNR